MSMSARWCRCSRSEKPCSRSLGSNSAVSSGMHGLAKYLGYGEGMKRRSANLPNSAVGSGSVIRSPMNITLSNSERHDAHPAVGVVVYHAPVVPSWSHSWIFLVKTSSFSPTVENVANASLAWTEGSDPRSYLECIRDPSGDSERPRMHHHLRSLAAAVRRPGDHFVR